MYPYRSILPKKSVKPLHLKHFLFSQNTVINLNKKWQKGNQEEQEESDQFKGRQSNFLEQKMAKIKPKGEIMSLEQPMAEMNLIVFLEALKEVSEV